MTVHPVTQDGIAGGEITLTCTVIGFPLPINIVWLKDGQVVDDVLVPDGVIQETPGNSLDITVYTALTISNLQLHDVANYTCNASNELVEARFDVADEAELTILCKIAYEYMYTCSYLFSPSVIIY